MAKKTAPRRKPKKPPRKTKASSSRSSGSRKAGPTSRWSTRQLRLRRKLAKKKKRAGGVHPGARLNVERSLLKRGDPLRKVPYARGHNFPTTVQLERGNRTPAAAVGDCRMARERLGLNQGDFAELIGKNESTVQAWETPNAKRRIVPPVFMQQLFGAFLHAQINGYELRHMVKVSGPVRAVYALLRSAVEGPRVKSALDETHTIAPREARRPATPRDRMLALRDQSNAECAAAFAADPAGAAAVDAATVVYKR